MSNAFHLLLAVVVLLAVAPSTAAQNAGSVAVVTNIASLTNKVPSTLAPVTTVADPANHVQGTFVYSKTSARPVDDYSVFPAAGGGQQLRVLPWQDSRILGSPWLSAQADGLTNYWAVGDSHTAGQVNIAGTSNWLSGGYILAPYRYPNILASRWGLNLTNLAVSGSAISQGNPGTTGPDLSSTLWQLSKVGPAWRGLMSVMHGYNDGYAWQDIASVQTWMESAQAASIAAAFATNWAGPRGTNWYGAAVAGWTNTGTLYDEGEAGKALLPVSGRLTDTRTSIRLAVGQTWSATLSGRVGLILERLDTGGVVAISTNGVVMAQRALDTTGNGYAATTRRLPALHLLDLASATTVTVTGLSGTNSMIGVVWVGSVEDAAGKRLVMSTGTPLGDHTIRSDGMIGAIGSSLFRAAAGWKEYPLWVTMAGAAIEPKADVYSTDKSHPGPSGHAKFADGFDAATPASGLGAQMARSQIDFSHLRSSGAVQAFGGGSVGQDYSMPSASMSFAGGYGAFMDAMAGPLGTLTNWWIRGNNVAVQYGGLSVLNSSTLGAVPQLPAVHLAFGGGQGYLDAYDYGTAAWKAMNYRSLNHVFDSGALSVIGATLSTNNFTRSSGAHLSFIGSQSYLDSYNYSNETYFPFNYRAKSHRFANGPLSVSASYLSVTDAPVVGALHLAYGGGQGYLDAYDYGTTNAKPLNVRGSFVNIPMGPLLVTAGSGSGIATNFGVMLFTDGTNAFVRATATNGYVPLGLQGNAINLQIAGSTRAQVDSGASNNAAPFLLYDQVAGSLKRVYIGAVGTAPGSGRMLYIDGTPGDSLSGLLTDGDKGDITVSGSSATWTIDADSVALGTDTTGNYVASVAGTANEVTASGSGEGAAVTLSLPSTIDLGGKTSFELPNAAAPTVDAFGEIAGDNDAWAASRGAVVFYDGTAATRLVGVLASDTPSNGQVPKWNTGGTITWEDDASSAGGGGLGTNLIVNGVLLQPAILTNSATVTWATNANGHLQATSSGGSGVTDGDKGDITVSGSGATWTIDADSVALGTDTTGNYVASVAGTANEVTASGSGEGAAVTLSLPSTIDLGGKTSFELPNAAAPTVDAFGEIAGDNDAWAASRGAVVFYDGTAATRLVGVLASDTPSNGQVPKWNTGGTITWEDDTSTSGGGGLGTNLIVNGVLLQPAILTNSATVTWATNASGHIQATASVSGGAGLGTNLIVNGTLYQPAIITNTSTITWTANGNGHLEAALEDPLTLTELTVTDINLSEPLPVATGGTGTNTFPLYAVLYGNTTNDLGHITATADRVLGWDGSGVPVKYLAGSGISISGGQISATGGGGGLGTNLFVNGVLKQPAKLTNSASVTWNTNASGDIYATSISVTNSPVSSLWQRWGYANVIVTNNNSLGDIQSSAVGGYISSVAVVGSGANTAPLVLELTFSQSRDTNYLVVCEFESTISEYAIEYWIEEGNRGTGSVRVSFTSSGLSVFATPGHWMRVSVIEPNATAGGMGGDVIAASNNVFTGANSFTNLLTASGGIEVTNYYLRVTGPSAGGRIFPSAGEGMELVYDATNWVESTGSSGRGEIQVYDRSGSSYGDFRFNARNVGFYGAGTLVLMTTNGQARVTGTLFVNSTNVMSEVDAKATKASPVLTNPHLTNSIRFGQSDLAAHSAGTNFVVDPTVNQYQLITVANTNAVRFLHLTNAAIGRQTTVIINVTTNTTVTVALAANQFANTTNLFSLTQGQILPISFYCYGANNTNVIASVPTLPFVYR